MNQPLIKLIDWRRLAAEGPMSAFNPLALANANLQTDLPVKSSTALMPQSLRGADDGSTTALAGPRAIRSFVLRRGHITAAQQDAYARLLPQWSQAFQPSLIDASAWFGREAPTFLEIGFGMGETTAQIAQAQPQHNFICIEVFSSGVGALLKRIELAGLRNIRIIQHDAVEVIQHMLPAASLAGVHLFFPDPWPKKRHHKRRLIQTPFVQLLSSRLQTGAYLHCATDWQHYAEQMLSVLSAEPALSNTVEGFAPRPAWRPMTKFEQRGLNLGNGVWDIIFKKS